ncbi:MAG: hypothetical protein A2X47_02365 [Lentisphaerae bacterium GWF2_38_69]|nr:MAG: hypothetical protein A2X47_02365 [Lentisphaerae bacterium GWF2_38_69]
MFQDEARFGRLPVIRSAWAPPGVRPNVKAAIEREFRYVYGAISPIEGELDWMTSEAMNTENMSRFLELVKNAHPDDHILMIVDGASSHKSAKLVVPENITLLGMPPYSPELNPVEHLWDHVREKGCANIFFNKLDAVVQKVNAELTLLASQAVTVASMFCWPWITVAI